MKHQVSKQLPDESLAILAIPLLFIGFACLSKSGSAGALAPAMMIRLSVPYIALLVGSVAVFRSDRATSMEGLSLAVVGVVCSIACYGGILPSVCTDAWTCSGVGKNHFPFCRLKSEVWCPEV